MIERKIIIGLITSTEYLQKIQPVWNVQLLESSMAKRVATWVWEYFDKYKKAPGKDIETIFFAKLRDSKIPKDIAQEIEEDVLPSLSEQYAIEGIDIQPLFDETLKYFSERTLLILSANVQGLVESGKMDDAIHAITLYKPITIKTNDISSHIRTVQQIRRLNRPVPKMLLSPWLREGQLTILYGNYGTGKSLVTLSVAHLLGLIEYEDVSIGPWQVKTPTGCLYIDGEIGELEMEERLKQFEHYGDQDPQYRTKVLSIPEYQLETEDSFYLANRVNQLKITSWLKENPKYKLIVLDSISTLFGLEDENNNSEWNTKCSPFIRDLRALGVACILLHHSGKDGKKGLRGASAMGAMAHNIFRIINHQDKSKDAGEAWFVIEKEKQRTSGRTFNSFGLHYKQRRNGKETVWEVTSAIVQK